MKENAYENDGSAKEETRKPLCVFLSIGTALQNNNYIGISDGQKI